MKDEPSRTNTQRVHAIVHGRVQGVNFRYYTQIEAVSLGLTGWVRNMDDGTVETIAEGDSDSLERFVEYLHKGPSSAWVTKVDVTWEETTDEFQSFRIRYF